MKSEPSDVSSWTTELKPRTSPGMLRTSQRYLLKPLSVCEYVKIQIKIQI